MITRVLPCFSFILIVTGYSLMLAASGQTPIATPLPTRTVPLSDSDAVHGVRLQTDVDAAKAVVDRLARRQAVIQRYARQVYRKPTQEELKRVAPDAEILEQYRPLLSQSGTGIFKLVPYNDCGDGSMTVSTLPGCSSLAMPGNGSSFSFREGTYHISRLADLRQDGQVLLAAGSLDRGVG